MLGLDVQPFRDFIEKYRRRQLVVEDFSDTIEAIDYIIKEKKFEPHSQPLQIQVLLNQLQQLLNPPQTTNGGNPTSSSNSIEVLDLLLDMRKELKSLKEQTPQTTTQIIQHITAAPAPEVVVEKQPEIEMSSVFVNPIDESKEIKGSINIESKAGSNIGDKLNKLKELKRRGAIS